MRLLLISDAEKTSDSVYDFVCNEIELLEISKRKFQIMNTIKKIQMIKTEIGISPRIYSSVAQTMFELIENQKYNPIHEIKEFAELTFSELHELEKQNKKQIGKNYDRKQRK